MTASVARRLLRAALPLAALAAALVVFIVLVKTRREAPKKPVANRGTLVAVYEVQAAAHRLRVRAQGTVIAARQVVLQPEVTGRVVAQSKELVPGGRFLEGETMLRIDARDYSLATKQQQANVDRAELELELERSRQKIAEREWQIIDEDRNATPEGRKLALRKPHVRVAEANVAAAKSARSTAKLRLRRTRLTAPFNAMVLVESVDVGQLVSPQTPLATLVGTDEFWVQVSIPMGQIEAIRVPGMDGDGQGSPARIWQVVNGKRVERKGSVVRLLGSVDPVGRMARLLVAIDDPLGLRDGAGREEAGSEPRLPMLLGAYVDVAIEGQVLEHAVEVPRTALREERKVFVYDEGKLAIRAVDVVWKRPDTVLVRSGLRSGDRVVVSRIASPVEGMPLRLPQAPGASSVQGAQVRR